MRFFSIVVCWTLVSVGAAQGALIPFVDRNEFESMTTLGTGLSNANGINFTSTALCPEQKPSNQLSGMCAPTSGANPYNDYANPSSGVNSMTLTFAAATDFNIQGFSNGTSSGTVRLILYSPNYVHPTRGTMKYNEPVLTTRNTFDPTGNSTGSIRMRVNLPNNAQTTVNSFAMDLSNGCHIRGTGTDAFFNNATTGCDAGDNHLGSLTVTVGYADNTTQTLPTVSTTDTANVGDWNFVGAWSDTKEIIWVDVTLPTGNYGSIFGTRFAYGFAEAPVPEGSTFTLVGLGLLAAGLLRYLQRTTVS